MDRIIENCIRGDRILNVASGDEMSENAEFEECASVSRTAGVWGQQRV